MGNTGVLFFLQLFYCCYLVTKSSDSFVTPWTLTHQAPLSMGFPRQEYWSGLPFPSPGALPHPGIEPRSPALAGRFFTTKPPGKAQLFWKLKKKKKLQVLKSSFRSPCKTRISMDGTQASVYSKLPGWLLSILVLFKSLLKESPFNQFLFF